MTLTHILSLSLPLFFRPPPHVEYWLRSAIGPRRQRRGLAAETLWWISRNGHYRRNLIRAAGWGLYDYRHGNGAAHSFQALESGHCGVDRQCLGMVRFRHL